MLPGSQDVYYDWTKVIFHRSECSKLVFSAVAVSGRERDKLIGIGELERHFGEGWMFVSRTGDDKVVVRRVV
jgi:hypothetical protein